MRVFILIACLFAFTAGGFADLAHAVAPDLVCSHDHTDLHNADDDCVDEHTADQKNDCQDCCCIHTHVITGSSMNVSNQTIKDRLVSMPYDLFVSNDSSPLYRPPIA